MNPYIGPLIIVVIVNIIVLGLVYVLFKVLKSTARIEGSEGRFTWTAGGALAGFIILTILEIWMVNKLIPEGLESRPSYSAVKEFYGFQGKGQYGESWDLIHPAFQEERWRNNKARFVEGYENTERIKLLSITFVSEASPASHDYIVYYVDEVNTPVLDGLADIEKKTVRDLISILQGVDQLRSKVRENGFNEEIVNDLTLDELIAPNRGDKLTWYLEDNSGRSAAFLFPDRQLVEQVVGRRIVVHNVEGHWLIRRISRISTN